LAGYDRLSPTDKRKATYIRTLTYADLEREVCYAAEALKASGVRKGDAVAAYIANNAEAVVMVLAVNAVGAVWSSSAPEVKPPAVMDRFGQLKPKVLIVVDKFQQAGKVIEMADANRELVAGLIPLGLKRVVVVGQLEVDREPRRVSKFSGVTTSTWGQFQAEGKKLAGHRTEPKFERMEMSAPLWVLYSSGTTGPSPLHLISCVKLTNGSLRQA
jgi:acetoacetyl-CoA synthetase